MRRERLTEQKSERKTERVRFWRRLEGMGGVKGTRRGTGLEQ